MNVEIEDFTEGMGSELVLSGAWSENFVLESRNVIENLMAVYIVTTITPVYDPAITDFVVESKSFDLQNLILLLFAQSHSKIFPLSETSFFSFRI